MTPVTNVKTFDQIREDLQNDSYRINVHIDTAKLEQDIEAAIIEQFNLNTRQARHLVDVAKNEYAQTYMHCIDYAEDLSALYTDLHDMK